MVSKTNLPNRVEKAKFAAQFAAVIDRDSKDRPKVLLVPGTEAKRYRVIIRRFAGLVTTECHLEAGGIGHQECKGNSNGSICYHSLQAIVASVAEAGKDVYFCANEQDARKLANLGGSVIRLHSHQGKGEMWMVVK